MAYIDWIKTSAFYFKESEIIDRDKCCTKCGATKGLRMKHLYFFDDYSKPWQYPNEAFVTLCKKCFDESRQIPIPVIPHVIDRDESPHYMNRTRYAKLGYEHLSRNGKIKLGNYRFSSKANLAKFNRSMLDILPTNEDIETPFIVRFVHALYKLHPNRRDKPLRQAVQVRVSDSEYMTFTNFVVLFEDGDYHQFSSNKCIATMNTSGDGAD